MIWCWPIGINPPTDAADQAGRAVGDDQQRRAQPTPVSLSRKSYAALPSFAATSRPIRTGLPAMVMPHAARVGSARAPGTASPDDPSLTDYWTPTAPPQQTPGGHRHAT